ncbi:MAG: signal peptidase II [Actinomycetaceae bacterium]|nr:signal peptidase II [Actinomycetaceae bacterium]
MSFLSRRGAWGAWLVLTALTIGVDWWSKQWALAHLSGGARVRLLGDFFSLELVHNPGAAFFFLAGHTWVFTVFAVAAIGGVIYAVAQVRAVVWLVALALFAGGGAGNLLDRLFREPGFGRGHVVDFLNYNNYFVGNVADIAIVVSVLMLLWLFWRGTATKPADLMGASNA